MSALRMRPSPYSMITYMSLIRYVSSLVMSSYSSRVTSTSMTSMSCDSPVTYGKTSTECTRHRCIARPERTMSTSRSYEMGNDCPSKRWSRYIVSSTVDMKSKRSVHGTRHSCNEDSKARLTTSFPHSSRIQRF